MDRQYSNDNITEVDCNQSFGGRSIPVIGAPVPSSVWNREASFPGSSSHPPFLMHSGWSVGTSKPMQTQRSWRNADMKEDQEFSGSGCDMKQLESNSNTELMASYLQATTVDKGASTVTSETRVPNYSNKVLLPGDPNNDGRDKVLQNLAKDSAGEVLGEEERGETYWVPKVLWTEDMIELHARVKVLTRKCRGRKDSEMHTELKIARGKFKYWYKRTRAAMQELPDFEELKKIAMEEMKCSKKEKMQRQQEEEQRRIRKLVAPPLITGPPLIGTSPVMTRPPLMSAPPLLSGPPLMTRPPLMTGAPQAPMLMPSGNRRHFNRGTRRQRELPFYSNSSNTPRFPDRHDSGWSPDFAVHSNSRNSPRFPERHDSGRSHDGAEPYRRGHRSGFVSSAWTGSKPYETSRNFKQSSSSGFSAAW